MSGHNPRGNRFQAYIPMQREDSLKKKAAGPETGMADQAEKRPPTAIRSSGIPDFSHLPAPWAQNCQELWDQGAQTVQRPDGTHDNWDVVDWLLTRKGGAAANWPTLDEGQKAIEAMREEPFDLVRIREEMEQEQIELERKEKRRLANKMRFRPRGEWDKAGNGKTGDKEGLNCEAQGRSGGESNEPMETDGDGNGKLNDQANGNGELKDEPNGHGKLNGQANGNH